MKKLFLVFSTIYFLCLVTSTEAEVNITGLQADYFAKVETNLARYSPGDTVNFTALFNSLPAGCILQIKYFHLDDIIYEQSVRLASSLTIGWSWITPQKDYQGYLAVISLMQNNQQLDEETIAIDVSSSWKYFPRYGFLSSYPQLSIDSIKSVIGNLNRYHINGIQFYDWQYKHNMPLKGTPTNPAPYWNDIANRTNYFSTVKDYINEVHRHNMMAMSYNLLYGAYDDAYQDGVDLDGWGLYKDQYHQTRWMYSLPTGWASNLIFMDPSNTAWQSYLFNQERKAFQALPFDGWHVDQVGDNGIMYNYSGKLVSVSDTFNGFLKAAKDSLNVNLVMNAVNQYGQQGISLAPVDFLYSEVWDPNITYADLVRIISTNSFYCSGKMNSVLAAYVNYNLANSPGYFNTPGVILLDAVIFAAGGSHIELGEHMLGKEYFPNSNLQMKDDLKEAMIRYYDFLCAYENVLRDSVTSTKINITASSGINLATSPQQGTVWYFSKTKGDLQVIHLINFVKANSILWRDANGTQVYPDTITNLPLSLTATSKVNRIWIASPDFDKCSPSDVPFTESNGTATFVVPSLNYWDMIVVEYSTGTSSIENENEVEHDYSLEQNYPNPFNPQTVIPFRMKDSGNVQLSVYNILGSRVFNKTFHGHQGQNEFTFNGNNLESGVYFYQLRIDSYSSVRKMIYLK